MRHAAIFPLDDTLAHTSYMLWGPLGVHEGPEKEGTGVGIYGDIESFLHYCRGERPRDVCARFGHACASRACSQHAMLGTEGKGKRG